MTQKVVVVIAEGEHQDQHQDQHQEHQAIVTNDHRTRLVEVVTVAVMVMLNPTQDGCYGQESRWPSQHGKKRVRVGW